MLPTFAQQDPFYETVISFTTTSEDEDDEATNTTVETSILETPTYFPSIGPSISMLPSGLPSNIPSTSHEPSKIPSISIQPTITPSSIPSVSFSPSNIPSIFPSVSNLPSDAPSMIPSDVTSTSPSEEPTFFPTDDPTSQPTTTASTTPSTKPSLTPVQPPPPPKQLISYGGTPPSSRIPLGQCEGDCDNDSQCANGMICYQRDEEDPVPGCYGIDTSRTDYCIYQDIQSTSPPPPSPSAPTPTPPLPPLNSTVVHKLVSYGSTPPSSMFPLGPCEGDCDNDNQCDVGLICFQRGGEGYEHTVPGCDGDDTSNTDYCVYDGYTDNNELYNNYIPGKLNIVKEGLLLSQGLDVRLIATSGQPVSYTGPGVANNTPKQSSIPFHGRPDAAATFRSDNGSGGDGSNGNSDNKWIYVSNSEMNGHGNGGVGAITFDSLGNALEYKMVLTGTTRNCGGGKTPWDTWISCEENGPHGEVYQVDPTGQRQSQKLPIGEKGNWESFAYDIRDPNRPHFYITEDSEYGCLRRYTTIPKTSPLPPGTKFSNKQQYWDLLHGNNSNKIVEYLVLNDNGTYTWTTNLNTARQNAQKYYQYSEGIDVYKSYLYFVCKVAKELFILDLDNMTWTKDSTVSGLFNGAPDQLQRIFSNNDSGSSSSNDDHSLLYFTEEAGKRAGIHARDSSSRYYTVVESIGYPGETTGLALSPNNKYMLFSFQDEGKLFMIWRRDNLPFPAKHLDIKYHDF